MSKVYRRCCGMEVHKETVVVCVLAPDGEEGEQGRKVCGTFQQPYQDLGGTTMIASTRTKPSAEFKTVWQK